MTRFCIPILLALLGVGPGAPADAAGTAPSPAALVARLRGEEATYEDWKPILAAGKEAVPELKGLLTDRDARVQTAAATLLYRLGEASALDALDSLLGSADESARREAAAALFAFVGQPADFDPGAEPDARAAALARWRSWWKDNRRKVMERAPGTALHGKILRMQADTGLAVVSLSAKHGATQGMSLYVRRGDQAVCLLEVALADPAGSVARVVELSERTPPKPGDLCFWIKK